MVQCVKSFKEAPLTACYCLEFRPLSGGLPSKMVVQDGN